MAATANERLICNRLSARYYGRFPAPPPRRGTDDAVRRNWRRLAVAILLLAAIGLGATGLFWAATRGPLVGDAIGRVLGRRVEIASIALVPARALEIEVTGLVIYDPDTGEPQVEVPHARARQPWPWLLAGEFFPREWQLDSPLVRLWPERSAGRGAIDLPPLDLSVSDGSIELHTPRGEVYRVSDLALQLQRSALVPRARGTASGTLRRGEHDLGHFDADVVGWLDDATASVALDGVRLESLPFDLGADPSGTARGSLRVRYQRSRIGIEVDAAVSDFELRVQRMSALVAPSATRLRGRIVWSVDGITVESDRTRLDDLVVSGRIEVGSGDDARVLADLSIGDFSPGRPAGERIHPFRLLGMRFATWERANRRIEKGRVEGLRIRLDLPRQGFADSIGFNRRLSPEELLITARVRDGIYRPAPGAPPLEDINGEVEIIGNRLVIHELQMSRSGTPLPLLDIDVDGMHRLAHLPDNERGTPAGPGLPIPGLAAAAEALRRGPGGDRAPLRVRFADLDLAHPALVLPLRDFAGEMTFPDGKLRVGKARGIYGGAPAELELFYDPGARRLRADVRYLDGEAAPPGNARELWLSGRASIPIAWFGSWPLREIRVNLAAQAGLLSLDGGRARFGGGETELRGTIALDKPGEAPVDFHTRAVDADVDALNAPLGLRPGSLSGRADVDAQFSGRLRPGHRFLEDADFAIDIHAVDGAVAHLPATVALARVPSLQGIRGLFGRPLPYDEINAHFLLQQGVLRTESLSLAGPELRVLAAGEVKLLEPDRPEDILLAFLFLQTVDRMIELVPVLGSWVLGEDENLVTVYVRLQGPWRSPDARLVPPQSVRTAAGWAERMIGAGVSQLRRILSLPAGKPEPADPPEETSELARPG